MLEGVTMRDEQHIMQKTIAKNRYPVFEKLLELDLDLTSLKDSILSSYCKDCKLWLRGLLTEVLERLSQSSRMFFGTLMV